MKTTEYAGIDYGLGKSNVDTETGIRFGVIGQSAEGLNLDATQDIYQQGENLSFKGYQDEVRKSLRDALSDYFSDHKSWTGEKESQLDRVTETSFDAISDDLNDQYQGENDRYLYERDGYVIQTTETELMILKSPYFTHAQYCSPCFPGGGNLETYCETGPKTYCLGHDWFEDGKAPYPVLSVAPVHGSPVDPA